jgi:putative heme-binding domain-containing protein
MIALAFCASLLGVVEPPEAEWIWVSKDRPAGESATLALQIDLDGGPGTEREVRSAALFVISEHCDARVELNVVEVGTAFRYGGALRVDVRDVLRRGPNLLMIHGERSDGSAAVALRLDVKFADGSTAHFRTDARSGWSVWAARERKVVSFGAIAEPVWSQKTRDARIDAFDDYEQWRQALEKKTGTDPGSFFLPDGFEIELLRSAQKEEGSWVSVTFDPKGRLFVGVEAKGILRMTLPPDGKGEIAVEEFAGDLLEPRGLLWAHDSLYVNANNSKTLYRLRDTNGDDHFDERKALYSSKGGNGHGRNALVLGPDDKIYVIHGDSPDLPRDLVDRTSPYREHRRGKRTREGHVLRFDADGSNGEIVAAGLRNPFGIDFNRDGEMFTYDADAEFDMGASWYRATHVRHLLSGADYGWRGVTGSWPPYFPESPSTPPTTLEVGKGSPTGVRFGTKSAFPPRYERALFILDWAYGRILAVHMTPRGASYVGRTETFLKGRPLNVTDLVFGPDGAMYFVTGGRKTQSGLYRVRWTGPVVKEAPPTGQQASRNASSAKARELRRRLEKNHRAGAGAAAIDEAWQHLGSADPWIRHAARLVLEHQPIADWEQRVSKEQTRMARLTALLALAHGAAEGQLGKISSRTKIGVDGSTLEERWIALHVIKTCFDRVTLATPEGRLELAKNLHPLYPSSDFDMNRDLSLLLARTDAPMLVPKTLYLLDQTEKPREAFHYLYVLRGVKSGWTLQQRERWARHFLRIQRFLGGRGFPTFLEKIRAEFLATVDDATRRRLELILASGAGPAPPEKAAPLRPFVRKWTVDELALAEKSDRDPPDPARGRKMFDAAKCSRCHRVGENGAVHGPDLTSAASRFGVRDLLLSMIEPSAVIAPKYRSVTVITRAGAVHTGQVIQSGDYRRSVLEVQTDPLDPRSIVKIPKPDVLSSTPSKTSPMPDGLLDTLEKGEILDLLWFLQAGGRLK